MIKKIQELGEKLYQTRKAIRDVEERAKQTKEALKILKVEVENELLDLMTEAKIGSIKSSSGESYAKSVRNSIGIVSPPHALKWCTEHNAVSIDKRLLESKLKSVEELPECFERTETSFISVRKPSVKKLEVTNN